MSMFVADNAQPADLGDEPEGWWDAVHAQVEAWLLKYQDDDDDPD